MKRVFGIETEYGITIDGREAEVDVVHESIQIVRSYMEHGTLMKWDYHLEDPHQDARGFRAAELLQDTDEAAYFEIDRQRALRFEEIKSDLVLRNGARFYNDHAHPEYSTPECSTLQQIVAQDKAGERTLQECARRRSAQLPEGETVRLYKNNTDFIGHSYGCHDNYLMSRAVPWERVVRETIPFLVTRQIFAGAGKMGLEGEDTPGAPGHYQISQRADFFSVLVSIDTMNRRPIVNTRDEPHADPARYRRFHVIIGDANMSEIATALKIGTTALTLELIERGHAPQLELADPVAATKAISRDPTLQWIVELRDGRKISAIEIQRFYLAAAQRHCDRSDADTRWLLREWENVLHDLEADYTRTVDRVDWAAKRALLEMLRQSENLAWDAPWLQSIDLEYHNVSPEHGLYHQLARSGQMRTFASEEDIQHALFHPPETTRAYFRGRAIARFPQQIARVQWDEITFANGPERRTVHLGGAVFDGPLTALNQLIRDSKDFAHIWSQL